MRCIWANPECEDIVATAYARGQWAGLEIALRSGMDPLEYERARFRLIARKFMAK
jgi:hypothetical protein